MTTSNPFTSGLSTIAPGNTSALLQQNQTTGLTVPGDVRMPRTPNPSINDSYNSFTGQIGRPILFQVVDPANQPIWNFLLAMHVNPKTFGEKFTKSKNVVMTYGGFVEFIWPDELDTLSAEGTTGAFLGPLIGLASGSDGTGSNIGGFDSQPGATGRHGSMAWERQEDMLDVFRHNGIVFDGFGSPAIRGRVMCVYDRGIYLGSFRTFQVKEDDSHAYSFELTWEFKVEATLYRFAGSQNALQTGLSIGAGTQVFQNTGAPTVGPASAPNIPAPTLDQASNFSPNFVLNNNTNTNLR